MDQAPKLEIKKPIENTLDLLKLSPEQKEKLKKRIAKWNGLVRIFVHPLFEKWREGEYDNQNSDAPHDNLQIEKALSRILAIDKENVPPLIIMEEEEFVPEFKKWLETIYKSSQETLYLVNTFPQNPSPKIKIQKLPSFKDAMRSINDPRNDPAWKALEKTLQQVGVRKILLGGMTFEMDEEKKDWTHKDPWMGRCIGIAMSHLSKNKGGDFEVELSALTAPFRERRNFADFKRRNKENK